MLSAILLKRWIHFFCQSLGECSPSVASSDPSSLFVESFLFILGSISGIADWGVFVTASEASCVKVWELESSGFTICVTESLSKACILLAWSLLWAWSTKIKLFSICSLDVDVLRVSGAVVGCSFGAGVGSRHRRTCSVLGCWDSGGCDGDHVVTGNFPQSVDVWWRLHPFRIAKTLLHPWHLKTSRRAWYLFVCSVRSPCRLYHFGVSARILQWNESARGTSMQYVVLSSATGLASSSSFSVNLLPGSPL